MASSKRRPSKQQRNRQNRRERAAREARSAHAGEATAISAGEREPVTSTIGPKGGTGSTNAGAARSRRPLADRIPGQRAVLMAFLFTLVSAATLLLSPIEVPRDVAPDDPRVTDESPELNDDGTVTIREDTKLLDEEGLALGAVILATPIAICGVAVAFTKRPQRSTAWTMAMIALSAFIFLMAGPYGVITLPSLLAVAVGGFQSRRAENRVKLAEVRAKKAERASSGGEVIDVEPVDETVDAADPDGSGEDD